jgi:uncharacterized protein (TIGR00369 family)
MEDKTQPEDGFAILVGYDLEDWSPESATVGLTVARKHLNRSGVLHGGVLTTLIDTACGYAGTHCAVPGNVRRAFTVSLNTQFISTARLGATLRAVAQKTGGGKSLFFAACEVIDADGTVIGRGDGVFKYRRGSDKPEGTPADQL